jgi:hypothetical protein
LVDEKISQFVLPTASFMVLGHSSICGRCRSSLIYILKYILTYNGQSRDRAIIVYGMVHSTPHSSCSLIYLCIL